MLLQLNLIKSEEAPTTWAGWRRSLSGLLMRAASRPTAMQVGELPPARREWLLGAAGAPRGLQLFRGWRTVVGVFGGLYGVLSYHIIT